MSESDTPPDIIDTASSPEATYYQLIDGHRERITLFVQNGEVCARAKQWVGTVWFSPEKKIAYLPSDREIKASIDKVLGFARTAGVQKFGIHPKFRTADMMPRLVKKR